MSKRTRMPVDGGLTGLLVGATILATSLVGCTSNPGVGGTCCTFTGPVPYDCASIETLPSGADYDGRCNQVNQGQSCAWDYTVEECCAVAVDNGIGDVACPPGEGTSGTCCKFTGPVGHDCAAIENLGPGADLDGRCTQVNQGQSCSWYYSIDGCCEKAIGDGFPGTVQCN